MPSLQASQPVAQAVSAAGKSLTFRLGGEDYAIDILRVQEISAKQATDGASSASTVAGEVRNLAGRSAEAAREIKSLITDSVAKVDTGHQLVREAGSTMVEIVDQVRRVNDLIVGMSSATQEQSSGITQVGQAIGQLDRMTQQNAALVEESTAAAESMRNQAEQLATSIAVFKV